MPVTAPAVGDGTGTGTPPAPATTGNKIEWRSDDRYAVSRRL
jgi:hypothetical protein